MRPIERRISALETKGGAAPDRLKSITIRFMRPDPSGAPPTCVCSRTVTVGA